MRRETQITFSLTDCWQGVKQARWLLVAAALCMGSLVFTYLLLKTPTFTASGLFKGSAQEKASGISKALALLGGGDSYTANEDPKVFLSSYPVMEEVVRSLHLQLTIRECKRRPLFSRIWRTLKAERAQRLNKSRRPDSLILREHVPSKLPFPDETPILTCSKLDFPGELSTVLDLHFFDASNFQVTRKSRLIGEGALDTPFVWEGGSFTLTAPLSLEKKSFRLTFIPMHAAARSLEKTVQVERSKNSQGLIHLSFTHPDRHLAAAIVNSSMDAFQLYLKEEGRRKIAQQMRYLRQKQDETNQGLESALSDYQAFLESHIDAGELILLDNELKFMAEKQIQGRTKLDAIAGEMQEIHRIVAGQETQDFPSLLERLKAEHSSKEATLTVEGGRQLIREQEQAIEKVRMEKEHYAYCLEKLTEPDFDASSLSKLIDDPTLETRFNKIHSLHRNLIDEKNWTAKEREQLQEELSTERRFLTKHLHDLIKGAALKDHVLHEHLQSLQKEMLLSLVERYEGTEKSLRNLAAQASHFPQKWLTEQKIELNTKMHTDMIESITKMIEVKNIGYHLDTLSSSPLMRAPLPTTPNSPRLFFGFIGGSFIGALLVLIAVAAREVRLGPTTSFTNLKALEKRAHPFSHSMDDLKVIHYELKKLGPVTSLFSQTPKLGKDLAKLLEKSGEKTLVVDLSKSAKNDTFSETSYGELLIPGGVQDHKEIVLGSRHFQDLLQKQREKFDKILLLSTASFTSLEVKILSELGDGALVVLNAERWHRLPPFPDQTLFLTQTPLKEPLSLKKILPFLERVTSFSLLNPLKKSSSTPQQTETPVP